MVELSWAQGLSQEVLNSGCRATMLLAGSLHGISKIYSMGSIWDHIPVLPTNHGKYTCQQCSQFYCCVRVPATGVLALKPRKAKLSSDQP